MNNRRLRRWTLMILSVVSCQWSVMGQTQPTNANKPTIPGVGSTIGGWLTSENPTNRYQDVLAWTGPLYQNGAPIASETGGSWDLWRSAGTDYYPFTGTNAASATLFAGPEIRGRFSAPGAISSQFGPEFGWQQNDVRLGVAVDFVYRNSTTGDISNTKKRFEFDFFGDKMVSQNAGLGLLVGFQQHERYPLFMPTLSLSFGNGSGFLGLFNSPPAAK